MHVTALGEGAFSSSTTREAAFCTTSEASDNPIEAGATAVPYSELLVTRWE